jgi:conjugal transfer pilus assembly protein TraW
MNFFIFGTFLGAFTFVGQVSAKDFGVQGHVWEIAEENILQVIEQRLAKLDIEELNKNMVTTVKKYTERPPSFAGLQKVRKISISYYDPSYTLDRDLVDHKGRLIHIAGTKINPLEQLPLREALVFIDGDDEEQVTYALHIYKKLEKKAKVILTNGAPLVLQKKHKIWMYFDQQGKLTAQLGIKSIPALVEQDGLRLQITHGLEEVTKR